MSGDFQINYLQQNGAKFGNFAGVSIGTDGIVTALFDNGVTRPVFIIPVATFTNPKGLQSLSGNTWISNNFLCNPILREKSVMPVRDNSILLRWGRRPSTWVKNSRA